MADYAEFEITETQMKEAELDRIVTRVKTEQAIAEPGKLIKEKK